MYTVSIVFFTRNHAPHQPTYYVQCVEVLKEILITNGSELQLSQHFIKSLNATQFCILLFLIIIFRGLQIQSLITELKVNVLFFITKLPNQKVGMK